MCWGNVENTHSIEECKLVLYVRKYEYISVYFERDLQDKKLPSKFICVEYKSTNLKKCITSVLSSTIYNKQNTETAQVPNNNWVNKHVTLY